MIPDGWERTTIGEHVDVLTGYAFKSSDYSSGPDDIRLLRGDNVAQHRIRWRDAQKLPQEKAGGLDRFALRLGDFVIALDRTWIPAGVKIAEITEADLPSLLVQRVARLRSKPSLEQSLMRQFFSGHGFEQYVKSVQTETAVPHISPNDLRELAILLPPLPEQKRIAETLQTWDRAIETVEALIANARAQKQALMQQLLPQGTTPPKKRLPGFFGEWREERLGSLADISKGEQKGRASLSEEGPVPVINGGITPSGYTDHPNTAANTITISEGGNSCGHVDLINQPFWCGGHCYALKNLKVDRDYLFAVLKHRQLEIMSLRVGSGLPNIQKKALSQFSIPVPQKTEQVKIGELAACADEEIAALEAQLTALRHEKAALMQQLLTGKRRVKLPEGEAA